MFNQSTSWKQTIFIMEGDYRIGFYATVDNVEQPEKYYHDIQFKHPMINGYALFNRK